MAVKMTMSELTARFEPLERTVKELDKIIVRGNGHPSLQEDVRNILSYVEEDKASRKFYYRLVVGVLITNLIAVIFAAGIWLIKIYPMIDQLSKELSVR